MKFMCMIVFEIHMNQPDSRMPLFNIQPFVKRPSRLYKVLQMSTNK
jgi:hypothetical protein